MNSKNTKYIYLSNLGFDGTVFITQILDWLHLYEHQKVNFDLYVIYPIQTLKNQNFIKEQKEKINSKTKLLKKFIYFLPSRGIFYVINTLVLCFQIFRDLFKYKKIVIFSRAIIGKEIRLLKKIFPNKIYFIYDGRAASAEENFYNFKKEKNYSNQKFKTLGHVFQTEKKTVEIADKIFVVSNVLKKYLLNSYNIIDNKFVLYPCLSDSNKFFFNSSIRQIYREKLGYSDSDIVILYAGGINSKWHMSNFIFDFFNESSLQNEKFKFLFLSADLKEIESSLEKFPILRKNCTFLKVENSEVSNYLNASDFGTLFREDTIMNNVASPTKFAEYMLCGLPTIISDNVGDYSNYVRENNLGYIITNNQMSNIKLFDMDSLRKDKFDRIKISEIGLKNFSKDSIIDNLVEIFQNHD
jgi:hypothetical protein